MSRRCLVKGGQGRGVRGRAGESAVVELRDPASGGIHLAHAPVPVLRLPDIHPLIDAEYQPYDMGVMGELDVRILTELFGGARWPRRWRRHGMAASTMRRSGRLRTPAEKESTASLGLFYYSRWKNADSAKIVHAYLCGADSAEVLECSASGRRMRRMTTSRFSRRVRAMCCFRSLERGVFVSEGFDLALARKLARQHCQCAGGGAAANCGAVHDLH